MSVAVISTAEYDQFVASYDHPGDATDTPFNSPLLRLLVTAGRELLARSFVERRCTPGEVIFREGEHGDTMYLIGSGRVVVFKGDSSSPIVLGYRGTGETIGEMAVLERAPRSATVVALDELRLLGLTRERFEQILNDNPSVSMGIMALLSSRLRQSDEALSLGARSEKRLIGQVSELESEKHRLEELQRLRQETSDLIIHDLRNPLSTISVAVKMLEMSLPDEALQANKELIDIANSASERMQRLVNTLLEVSQMDAGEAELILSDVDLGAMAKDVLARISLLDRKGIDLQAILPPDLPLIRVDRDKIERVLINLVDNALKYTPEKGRIGIQIETCDPECRIVVTDTGSGIPPEERERIFERFTQVAGEKRKRRGFGLGLAYCRLAIEAHGGHIWVEPGLDGIGSRFVFTLPRSAPPAAVKPY